MITLEKSSVLIAYSLQICSFWNLKDFLFYSGSEILFGLYPSARYFLSINLLFLAAFYISEYFFKFFGHLNIYSICYFTDAVLSYLLNILLSSL